MTHFFENLILKLRRPNTVRKNFIELWNKGVVIELFVTVGLTRCSAPSLVLMLVSAESGHRTARQWIVCFCINSPYFRRAKPMSRPISDDAHRNLRRSSAGWWELGWSALSGFGCRELNRWCSVHSLAAYRWFSLSPPPLKSFTTIANQ